MPINCTASTSTLSSNLDDRSVVHVASRTAPSRMSLSDSSLTFPTPDDEDEGLALSDTEEANSDVSLQLEEIPENVPAEVRARSHSIVLPTTDCHDQDTSLLAFTLKTVAEVYFPSYYAEPDLTLCSYTNPHARMTSFLCMTTSSMHSCRIGMIRCDGSPYLVSICWLMRLWST